MKILILEDDAGSQHILREVLESKGHECAIYDAPDAALEGYDSFSPEVVLTDIHMPGATGSDHVQSLCEKASARVIVMTGYPSFELCQEVINAGAQGFLVKPFKVQDFLELAAKPTASMALKPLKKRIRDLEAALEKSKGI